MSIQNFVYDFKNELKSKQINLKTTHLYELIAAAFGYKSYGSLKLKTVPLYVQSLDKSLAVEMLLKRCSELQLDETIAKLLIEKFHEFTFIYTTKEECADIVCQALDNDEFENSQIFQQLQKSFEIYPEQSVYPYLIAQFYCDCENNFSVSTGMQYLYDRYLQGKEISPTWKPDLEQFIARKKKNERFKENYVLYLTKASQLGSFPAQLQLSQFEIGGDFEGEEVLDEDEYGQYSTYVPHIEFELAKRGNERVLREIFDKVTLDNYGDLKKITDDELIQAWKWQKFALFLGFDLAKGNYQARAIDENGNYYDDDVGGPIFLAESGREDIHLPKLSSDQEVLVANEVKHLIEFYKNLDEFVFDRYAHNSSYVWSEDDWDKEEY